MSKFDEKAAKALLEAKQAASCQHRPENRSIDLDTADDFCGDCGEVLSPYGPGKARRLPGRKALDLIRPKLTGEFPDENGEVRLFYVEAVGDDEFNVLAAVTVNGRMVHRQFRIVRTGTDESFETVRL